MKTGVPLNRHAGIWRRCRHSKVWWSNSTSLAQVFRTLVETRGKLIDQERQAFGFDKRDEGKQQPPAFVSIQF